MNIAEILRNCPKGTKLYTPIFGDCFFDYIGTKDSTYQINVKVEGHIVSFLADGRYVNCCNGECMLFPSKNNRDWSTFNVPKYTFKPFDKVLVRDSEKQRWSCNFFSHIVGCNFCCLDGFYSYCLPYEGYEHLLGTTNNPE